MNEAHQSLEEILFDLAVQKPAAADRAAFLDHACRDNLALRAALDELIESHFGAAGFLPKQAPREPLPAIGPIAAPSEAPAQMIGRYKLLEKIGEGGFGDVWMAEQREPVKRRVALKILKPGMDSRQIVARFEAERQALAMMDHPNIAKILDAGTTDVGDRSAGCQPAVSPTASRQSDASSSASDMPKASQAGSPAIQETGSLRYDSATHSGRPYFVMELVRGIRITDYCDQNQLTTHERLDLFIKVCHAIQHAHQKGVVHRDIKPSNILVTVNDGEPVPKVIDFGIAKATQGELTDKTVFTHFQQFIGTPAYISPEQAEMSSLDIDTRADIYSLGVLLYELLVGQTPFDAREMMEGGLDALRRIIREKEPLRPSTKLNTLPGDERTNASKRRQTDAIKLVHQLQGDLDWIVMKCLEKDRARRYETANGLAMDIQRHLANEPIVARPPSTAYKIQKAWQRNKLAFSAAAAVALALIVGIGVSTWQMIRATEAEREQSRLRGQAESERREAQEARASETEHRQSAERARQIAQAQESVARRTAYNSDMNLAQQALQLNNLGRAAEILNRHRPEPGESDLRGWEWRYLWRLCRSDADTLCRMSNRVYSVSFSPDGRFLAVHDRSSDVSVWDLASKKPILRRGTGVGKQRIAFSPVTNQVAFSERGSLSKVILWDIGKGKEIREWSIPQAARELVFARDGKSLCALTEGESAGYIFLWDIPSGRVLLEVAAERDSRGEGNILALSNQGQTIARGTPGGGVTLIDVATARERRNWHVTDERTMAVAILNGGGILASAGGFTDPVIKLWDTARGEELDPLKGHRSYVNALATSPDGRLLASASGDQTIRIWDWKERRSIRTLRGHSEQVQDVAFSPDGQTLASGGKDGKVCLWNITSNRHERTYDVLPDAPGNWSFSPEGGLIVAVDQGIVRSWTTTDLQENRMFERLGPDKTSIAFSQSGTVLAVGTETGEAVVINRLTGAETGRFNTGPERVEVLGFVAEDHFLVTLDSKGMVNVWDLPSGRRKHQWTFPERPWSIELGGTADRLVTNYPGGWSVWRATDGQMLSSARMVGGNVPRLSHGGMVVAVPSGDGFTKLFDARTGAETAKLASSLQGNHSVGFSPDDQRLAIGSDGVEAVKVWDTGLGQELLTLEGQGSEFQKTAFSPDGRLLGSRGNKGLHLWRAPSWEEIAAAEAGENVASDKP